MIEYNLIFIEFRDVFFDIVYRYVINNITICVKAIFRIN